MFPVLLSLKTFSETAGCEGSLEGELIVLLLYSENVPGLAETAGCEGSKGKGPSLTRQYQSRAALLER